MNTATNQATEAKSEIVYLMGVPDMTAARSGFPLHKRIECTNGSVIVALRYEEGPADIDYAKRGWDRMVKVYGTVERGACKPTT